MFNEIHTPLFEKKLVKPYERFVLQVLTVLPRNNKGLLNTFKFNKKTHSTMSQIAKTSVEKDFYRLRNNANFGYNCRKNIYNYKFTAIYDEIEEVSYIQIYVSSFSTIPIKILTVQ